jgi:hypothetical protein
VLPGFTDAELVGALRASTCRGPLWDLASAVLARRGLRTLHALVARGALNAKLAALLPQAPFSVCPEELWTPDEWVPEAVAKGLDKFRRDTADSRGWTPDARDDTNHAGLTTWVINAMILKIPDVLRRERRQAARHAAEDPLPSYALPEPGEHSGSSPDPADLVISREECARLGDVLASMPADLAAVIEMQVETGWPTAACCKKFGLNPRAIEGKLYRWRRAPGGGGRHRPHEEPT